MEKLACRGPLSPKFLSFSFESLVCVFSNAIELFADLSSLFWEAYRIFDFKLIEVTLIGFWDTLTLR